MKRKVRETMEDCELCGNRMARMYCDSDQAKLCWACDEKVHGANFLVAKHSRTLLCRACQSPTPWNASGPKLDPTASFCLHCLALPSHHRNSKCHQATDHERQLVDDRDYYDEDDDEDFCSDADSENDDYDEDDGEEQEEGDNQVVPWSSATSPPPAAVATYANSDADGDVSRATTDGGSGSALNRLREKSFVDLDAPIIGA